MRTGYFLEGPDVGQPDPLRLYCVEHGMRAAKLFNRLKGWRHPYRRTDPDDNRPAGVVAVGCWAGDDSFQYCRICGELLDTGGLTDSGVREALRSPLETLSDGELDMLISVMLFNHPDWPAVCTEANRRTQAQPEAK